MYVLVWEFQGKGDLVRFYKEQLIFDEVEFSQCSYKQLIELLFIQKYI